MIDKLVTSSQGTQYRAKRLIGRGGFGVVYLVHDDAGNQSAMKVMRLSTDPAMRSSVQQEIESTKGMIHENLLNVLDWGSCKTVEDEDALFTICEYCPDGNYREYLIGNSQEPKVVAANTRQILNGLAVLHQRTVHRDLKPENIFMSGRTLRIGDFGLAKFVDEATRTMTFKGSGTPLYMAPEVWENVHVSPATDLYAVGIMLFEALAGQPPFQAEDAASLRSKHLYEPAPRVKKLNPRVPDLVDGIVKRMLEKEPGHRFQTAQEVIAALDQSLGSEQPANPVLSNLAERMRSLHDHEEVRKTQQARDAEQRAEGAARTRYMEKQLIEHFDDAVSALNSQLPELKITSSTAGNGKEFTIRNRKLAIHFFSTNELYRNPEFSAVIDVLKEKHVVRGGYVEIREDGRDREGWNIVLLRPDESSYGEGSVVETRVSATTGRRTQFEPIATQAQLLARNLVHHWRPAMDIYILKDYPFSVSVVHQILDAFIPKV